MDTGTDRFEFRRELDVKGGEAGFRLPALSITQVELPPPSPKR
jgi:hypothetical protein